MYRQYNVKINIKVIVHQRFSKVCFLFDRSSILVNIQTSLKLVPIFCIIVSKSDILGPNGNLSDIKNLISFEREMFGDSSYSNIIKNSYYLCQYHHFEIHA